ncbi:MAG: hypothetical protein H7318_13660 [Oligoflexus sp.]|nr:hypothetical protein [Oligoflexus sp.]
MPSRGPPKSEEAKSSPKKSRKAGGDAQGSAKKKSIAIVLVVICGIYYEWNSRRVSPVAEQKLRAAVMGTPTIIATQKELHELKAENQQRIKVLVAERAAGLQTLPLVINKGKAPLFKVSTKSFQQGCVHSDLDIIKTDLDLLAESHPSLVLSLEDIDPSSDRKPWQKTVSLEQLRNGYASEFVLEHVEKRTLMGLFLCTTHNQQRCSQQSTPSMSKLGQQQLKISSGQVASSEYPKADKVFFFHFLVAYPDRFLLHDPGQTLESSRARLVSALEQGGGEMISQSMISEVMRRLLATDSFPAIVMSDSLQLQLPHKGDQCP